MEEARVREKMTESALSTLYSAERAQTLIPVREGEAGCSPLRYILTSTQKEQVCILATENNYLLEIMTIDDPCPSPWHGCGKAHPEETTMVNK